MSQVLFQLFDFFHERLVFRYAGHIVKKTTGEEGRGKDSEKGISSLAACCTALRWGDNRRRGFCTLCGRSSASGAAGHVGSRGSGD